MKFKDRVQNLILDKLSEVKKRIRNLEDESRKFSVAPSSNGVYTALVGSREALQEILSEIRSLNENDRSDRNI